MFLIILHNFTNSSKATLTLIQSGSLVRHFKDKPGALLVYFFAFFNRGNEGTFLLTGEPCHRCCIGNSNSDALSAPLLPKCFHPKGPRDN